MRNLIKTILLAFCLMSFVASSRAADFKLGIVDMRKTFDEYYKTKLANQAITNEANEIRKSLDAMKADAEKVRDDILKAEEKAGDQGISADERDKNKKIAQQKREEFQSMANDISNYEQRQGASLSDKRKQRIDVIVGEIRTHLTDLARKGGFTLVLDKSGETMPGVPVVLYTMGENDLTDALIKDLNAGAPTSLPDDAKPAAAPANGAR